MRTAQRFIYLVCKCKSKGDGCSNNNSSHSHWLTCCVPCSWSELNWISISCRGCFLSTWKNRKWYSQEVTTLIRLPTNKLAGLVLKIHRRQKRDSKRQRQRKRGRMKERNGEYEEWDEKTQSIKCHTHETAANEVNCKLFPPQQPEQEKLKKKTTD